MSPSGSGGLVEAVLVERDDYVPPRVRVRASGEIRSLDRFTLPAAVSDGDVVLVRLEAGGKYGPRAAFVAGPVVSGVAPLSLDELLDVLLVGGSLWPAVVALARERGPGVDSEEALRHDLRGRAASRGPDTLDHFEERFE